MTEKRFIDKIKNGTMVIIDKKDNVLIRDKYRACDYLNMLNNENEELKSEIKDLKFENEKKYREIKQLEQMLHDVER